MTVHLLTEYETRELRLASETVSLLADRHWRHLALAPAPGRGRWFVSATSHVGSIRAGEETFLIRPKARLSNLLAMMGVEISSETWQREVVELDTDPDLLNVMARLFCVACEHATARGVRRAYEAHEELLVSPRGRIHIAELARQPGLPSPVACRFDEHTADIPLNRLLKAAVECARRVPAVNPRWKYRLRAQLIEFSEVVTPARDIDWVASWKPQPMERHYETAVRLGHLLLTSSSLRDQAGATASNAFLLNMNDLFEKWVTARLAAHAVGLSLRAKHRIALGDRGEIPMNPDVTFWRDDDVVGVADCKYKLMHDGDGRSADCYQALAYATALGLSEATLIYARFPGDPEGGSVRVRNSGCELRTIGLDLTGSLADADAVLGEVARGYENHAAEWSGGTRRRLVF